MRRSKYNYSSYNKKRIKWDKLAIFVGIPLVVIVLIVGLNFNRIKLLVKGYSFSEASVVLKLSKENKNELLSKAKVDDVTEWIELDINAIYYDEYAAYLKLHPEMSKEEVVSTIYNFMETKYQSMLDLNYTDENIWTVLATASMSDVQSLIDNRYTFETVSRFNKYKYFDYQKIGQYILAASTASSDEYAVNITNFPFIISSNETTARYTIQNPEEVLTLVKKGFYLPSTYVPSDLVVPNIAIAPDNTDNTVRAVAGTALEEMFAAAAGENMQLVFNSGYRSYDEQTKVYNEIEGIYGGIYVSEYVALPGASEHQTGLGVDITSQSVVDGTRITFGDTAEYQWVIENCHRFGFIVRFDTDNANITGIANEPWHLRFVGVEVATEIKQSGITFEEYCLKRSIIPELS